MTPVPQISESELILMRIIWKHDGAALYADIMDDLAQSGLDWKKNTVLTFLSRLVDKKMLSTNKIGRRNEYTALIPESAYQADQTRQLVDKVYHGKVQGLVNQLVQGAFISAAEADALEAHWREETKQ